VRSRTSSGAAWSPPRVGSIDDDPPLWEARDVQSPFPVGENMRKLWSVAADRQDRRPEQQPGTVLAARTAVNVTLGKG